MSRVACLVVPRFAVAALRRAEPELRGCPVVVCEPEESGRTHARLLEVSAEAARFGVQPGLTVLQGLARHADLVVRPLDTEALAAARAALAEVGASVSPRVEVEGATTGLARAATPSGAAPGGARDAPPKQRTGARSHGVIYLDVEGLERLFGSAAGILAALSRRAERVGLEAGVAIADRKATARIAAGLAARRGEAIVVPPAGDATWLAPLPLAVLAPVAEGAAPRSAPGSGVAHDLARLGITRLGQLAALPAAELASRFGAPGARLQRIAAGREDAPLVPTPVALEVVEGTALEYGVSSLESLLFVVRGLLDRIVVRLRLHGLACRGLTVSLGLEDGGLIEREVGVLAPTCDVKSLALLTRATIEAAPPRAAIESVRLAALPDRARPDQLDLFRAPGPPPERLATALSRLAALCGQARVGRPVAPPGHRPEAWHLRSFVPLGVRSASSEQRTGALTPAPARLALRALRPPRPAEVFLEAGRIAYVRADGLGGRAIATAGPWRVEVEWWSEAPLRRDTYEVQLSDGGLYRLVHDRCRWYVDGYYD